MFFSSAAAVVFNARSAAGVCNLSGAEEGARLVLPWNEPTDFAVGVGRARSRVVIERGVAQRRAEINPDDSTARAYAFVVVYLEKAVECFVSDFDVRAVHRSPADGPAHLQCANPAHLCVALSVLNEHPVLETVCL